MQAELPLSGLELANLTGAILRKGSSARFRAPGASMFPFIRHNDVVSIAPPPQRPAIGDILAFRHPESGRLIVHRVIARSSSAFLTRGDRAPSPDGWIPAARILGRVTLVERRGAPATLGLGPERLPIALLSRAGILQLLTRAAVRLYRLLAPPPPAT